PLHLWALGAGRQGADAAVQDTEAPRASVLGGRLVKHLHAHADAEERKVAPGRVHGDGVEPRGPKRLQAATEGPDAGQDHAVGPLGLLGLGHQPGVTADALERLLGRPEVADPVVQDGDHSRPFVDGTSAPSTRTASRSERATALNEASRMWWVLRPLRRLMCSVIAADVVSARQNSSASCGSNAGLPSGTAAGATFTSYWR